MFLLPFSKKTERITLERVFVECFKKIYALSALPLHAKPSLTVVSVPSDLSASGQSFLLSCLHRASTCLPALFPRAPESLAAPRAPVRAAAAGGVGAAGGRAASGAGRACELGDSLSGARFRRPLRDALVAAPRLRGGRRRGRALPRLRDAWAIGEGVRRRGGGAQAGPRGGAVGEGAAQAAARRDGVPRAAVIDGEQRRGDRVALRRSGLSAVRFALAPRDAGLRRAQRVGLGNRLSARLCAEIRSVLRARRCDAARCRQLVVVGGWSASPSPPTQLRHARSPGRAARRGGAARARARVLPAGFGGRRGGRLHPGAVQTGLPE